MTISLLILPHVRQIIGHNNNNKHICINDITASERASLLCCLRWRCSNAATCNYWHLYLYIHRQLFKKILNSFTGQGLPLYKVLQRLFLFLSAHVRTGSTCTAGQKVTACGLWLRCDTFCWPLKLWNKLWNFCFKLLRHTHGCFYGIKYALNWLSTGNISKCICWYLLFSYLLVDSCELCCCVDIYCIESHLSFRANAATVKLNNLILYNDHGINVSITHTPSSAKHKIPQNILTNEWLQIKNACGLWEI